MICCLKTNEASSFTIIFIIIYFEDDFIEENKSLGFLKNLKTKEEIINFVNKLTSRFVMKFDSDFEKENDFIYDYIING